MPCNEACLIVVLFVFKKVYLDQRRQRLNKDHDRSGFSQVSNVLGL
jgi:hypothetical protein